MPLANMEEIYQAHARTVYKFLLSQCHDADLAEELTQETFYQAVRSIDRFNGSCKVSVWLCQIAKHLWYQHLRKRKPEEPLPEDGLPGPSAEEDVLTRQGQSGPAAANPCPAPQHPGGGVPPGLRGPQLPGDRGRAGTDGDLGPGDVLPGQGGTAERRSRP